MKREIKIDDLRRIIREELQETDVTVSGPSGKYSIDHEGAAMVVSSASKLLSALQAFEEKAPIPAKNALLNRAPDLKSTLEDMVQSPASYVTKQVPQDVTVTGDIAKPIERPPSVRVSPRKPVIDHKVIESINNRIRGRRRSS